MLRVKVSSFLSKLKTRWNIESTAQVILILLTFTLTGSTVVYLRKWLFAALHFNEQTPLIVKVSTYLLFVFPAYQLLILVFGTLLGQGKFFWEKEKKLFYFIKNRLRK